MHRHLDLYNMLRYELGSKRIPSLVPDNRGNTPLHLVGLTSRKAQLESMSRSTLMFQREYLWFQEVEKMLTPHLRSLRNDDGKTAYELFQENTIDLASSGLGWMKQAMVGAALIVTVSFAAVLTPPGGYNQETGFPIFMKQPFFLVYLITTGFSLLSSSLTFLILLSIITSRSRPHDFLRVLPRKVIATLISLFLSVLSLMAAYAACCIVLYRAELKWILICLGLVASLPVFIFAALQFPIWLEIVLTTYRPTHLFNPKIGLLYPKERR